MKVSQLDTFSRTSHMLTFTIFIKKPNAEDMYAHVHLNIQTDHTGTDLASCQAHMTIRCIWWLHNELNVENSSFASWRFEERGRKKWPALSNVTLNSIPSHCDVMLLKEISFLFHRGCFVMVDHLGTYRWCILDLFSNVSKVLKIKQNSEEQKVIMRFK